MAEKRTGTREWSDVSLNIQTGCRNGCVYCYARQAALRRRLIARPEDWTQEYLVAPEVRRARARRSARGVTMFPTTHDLNAANVEAAIEAIRLCLDAGRRVLVVTKPDYQTTYRICEAFDGANVADRLAFRVTVTGMDESIRRVWEPQAPTYQERFEVLGMLQWYDYPRSVSMEPLLEPEVAEDLARGAAHFLNGGQIWIGLLRKLDERTAWWRMSDPDVAVGEIERIRRWQTPEAVLKVYMHTCGVRGIWYKDSYREVLAAQGVLVGTPGESP